MKTVIGYAETIIIVGHRTFVRPIKLSGSPLSDLVSHQCPGITKYNKLNYYIKVNKGKLPVL